MHGHDRRTGIPDDAVVERGSVAAFDESFPGSARALVAGGIERQGPPGSVLHGEDVQPLFVASRVEDDLSLVRGPARSESDLATAGEATFDGAVVREEDDPRAFSRFGKHGRDPAGHGPADGVHQIFPEASARSEPLGVKELKKLRPNQRTAHPDRSPKPLVHAASRDRRRQFREGWRPFVELYLAASERLRNGFRDTTFPPGVVPTADAIRAATRRAFRIGEGAPSALKTTSRAKPRRPGVAELCLPRVTDRLAGTLASLARRSQRLARPKLTQTSGPSRSGDHPRRLQRPSSQGSPGTSWSSVVRRSMVEPWSSRSGDHPRQLQRPSSQGSPGTSWSSRGRGPAGGQPGKMRRPTGSSRI